MLHSGVEARSHGTGRFWYHIDTAQDSPLWVFTVIMLLTWHICRDCFVATLLSFCLFVCLALIRSCWKTFQSHWFWNSLPPASAPANLRLRASPSITDAAQGMLVPFLTFHCPVNNFLNGEINDRGERNYQLTDVKQFWNLFPTLGWILYWIYFSYNFWRH